MEDNEIATLRDELHRAREHYRSLATRIRRLQAYAEHALWVVRRIRDIARRDPAEAAQMLEQVEASMTHDYQLDSLAVVDQNIMERWESTYFSPEELKLLMPDPSMVPRDIPSPKKGNKARPKPRQ